MNKEQAARLGAKAPEVAPLNAQMNQIVHSTEFMDTMSRFVPPQIRKGSVDRPEFLQYMSKTVEGLFQEVHDALNDSDQSNPNQFVM